MDAFDTSLIERGGPLIWVLLGVSLTGFLIFIERTLYLHKSQIKTEDFLTGLQTLLKKRRYLEALTVCEEAPGPIPAVIKAGLLHANEGIERIRLAMQAAALVEIPMLERRIGTLAAIARIAPLLGLAGTVLGIIEGFNALGAGSLAYPTYGALLGGLGQALYTTLAGLLIAVMALGAHHFLYGRLKVLVHEMEYAGHQMLEFLDALGREMPDSFYAPRPEGAAPPNAQSEALPAGEAVRG